MALSWIAEKAARSALEAHELRSTSTLAAGRAQSLLLRLHGDNDGAAEFLRAIRFRCLSGRPRERVRACIEDGLASYVATQGALAARLSLPGAAPIDAGTMPGLGALPLPSKGQLVRIAGAHGNGLEPRPYVIVARDADVSLAVAFSTASLRRLFERQGGLGESAESFLVDANGLFVTPPRHRGRSGAIQPLDSPPIRRCLSGEDGEMIAPDHRNVKVINAFRYLPEAGGACIVAQIDAEEAFRPARMLQRRIILFGVLFTLIAVGVAAAMADRLAGPLGRLTDRVRRFRSGDLEAPVGVNGPTEIRTLASTFEEMTRAISDSRQARESSAARTRFLGETTALLSTSLDYVSTLRKLAHLSIPTLGEWCVVLVHRDGTPEHVAVAHIDPAHEPLARSLERRLGAGEVPTEESVIHPDVRDTSWVPSELGAEHPALLRELRARSYMIVPMPARKRTLGGLVFASGTRRFTREDLELAEQLARRAAIAIDNARLYDSAKRAIRTRDDVLAVVSHDLKNPLSSIAMSAGLLSRRAPDGELGDFVRRHAELIERSVSRMKGLIDDLLDLATLEPGKVALAPAPQEPWRIVADVVEVLRPLAVDKGVEIESDISRFLPKVSVDKKRAYQVLSNVVANAVKYTPAHG